MHPSHGHGGSPTPGARYEKSDLTPQAAAMTLFGLALLATIAAFVIWLFKPYILHVAPERTSKFPIPREAVRPAEPRLQANPTIDIENLRKDEDFILNTYSRDPISHRLHIPVERAMEIVAREGLPTRPNPAQPDPMEPNEPSYTIGQASDQLPQATMQGAKGESETGMPRPNISTETYQPGMSSMGSP
ncbi:hypothetical protein CWRG_00930 [Chthonomonas calidirosea]|uniref:hypothetical protein n=1 Tax=Chthonomonas calidirosea TaxID=454171 RepID=UPI0006DD4FC7|nr:hypothetical protein [Chthonomonas calidirosea]CEK14751.1 hypothetical protein CWRG_00930 [Chthonomonas calidirosea]